MNTVADCTVTRGLSHANALGVQCADAPVRTSDMPVQTTYGAPWVVRVAASYALSTVASEKGLGRALHRARPTISRYLNYTLHPVADSCEVAYQIAARGQNAEPLIDAIRAAAELGAREHARRFGAGRVA